MLRGVTFDYDGTIGQTLERQFAWLRHWAAQHDKTLEFADIREFAPFYNKHCGKGGVQNVYDALGLPCDMADRTHPVWAAYNAFKAEHQVSLYPGVEQAVRDIWKLGHLTSDPQRNRRLRLAINTTNTWGSIHQELRSARILHCFDCFVTDETLRQYYGSAANGTISKPSTISLALTLGLIDSPGEAVLHIGDTRNDLVASQKIMRLNPQQPETLLTVGCTWGYEGRKELEKGVEVPGEGTVHFNRLVDEPSQLVGIVRDFL